MSKFSKETLTGSSLKGFGARHRHSLSIIGLTLILVTFIAKDAYREHAKDVSDAMEAEYYHFELRNDIYLVEQRLKGFSPDLFEGVAPKTIDEAVKLYDLEYAKTQGFLDGGLGMTVTWLSDEDKRDEVFDYGFDESEFDERLERISEERQGIRDPTELFRCVVKQINEVRAVGAMVATAVENANSQRLKDIKAHKIAAEKIYQSWTHVSYGLFLTGWLLALWGRLSGVQEVSGED